MRQFIINRRQQARLRAVDRAFLALADRNLTHLAAALRAGATAADYNATGLTLLHLAARDAPVSFLQEIRAQDNAFDANLALADGRTPLHLAVQFRNLATTRWLLDNGADFTRSSQGLGTALHLAARSGSIPLIRALVDHGARWDSRNASGISPMDVLERYHPDKVKIWASRPRLPVASE